MTRELPGGRTSLGGRVRGYSAALTSTGSAVEIGLTLGRALRAGRAVGLTLAAGLTDAAPDFRVSVGWRWGRLAGWRVGRP